VKNERIGSLRIDDLGLPPIIPHRRKPSNRFLHKLSVRGSVSILEFLSGASI